MNQIPDAPWIRDAELNGYPSADPVVCPVCGEECEEIFEDVYGTVVGCDRCLISKDAWEWAEERKEADRDDS